MVNVEFYTRSGPLSDAAIATVVTGLITIVTMIAGVMTLWIKSAYAIQEVKDEVNKQGNEINRKQDSVSSKLDHNTAISEKAKESAAKAELQTNGALSQYKMAVLENASKIAGLEKDTVAIRMSLDVLAKSISETRHEMRGHLQGVIYKLDLLALKCLQPTEPPCPPEDKEK